MNDIYLGLGSNLNGPIEQIKRAIKSISDLPESTLMAQSALYQSAPLLRPESPQQQPYYVNAVVFLQTALSPYALLDQCQQIEKAQGRVRGPRPWSPRTLDIDILVYGQKTINDARLIIPHPGLVERNFVLYPLYEIAPELSIPGLGRLAGLVENCDRGELALINGTS